MKKPAAELFLSDYKAILKQWSMTSVGIGEGNALTLFQQLKRGLPTLTEIATAYPELSYSVDLLSNALTREFPDQAARSLRPDDMSFI